MPLSRPARLPYYRVTLAMAWVAMCLLFAGPLISQFQASHHDHGHHAHSQLHNHSNSHHHNADAEHHHPTDEHAEHPVAHSPPPDTATGRALSSTLSDWHNQCGYCELWQHSPSLSIALPALAHEAFVALGGAFLTLQTGAFFQYNYPHALTRGPPSFIFEHLKTSTRTVLIVTRKSKKETGLLGFLKA
ncbi:DUF2946 domain-containing protein [Halomonas sp. AOP43-D1-4]|uniref:DUF2946 domain-containing protein n=1 Tax=Halomonas sp. AOP43-D1-4 TaxID=3457658 RepID=UPI0040349CAC